MRKLKGMIELINRKKAAAGALAVALALSITACGEKAETESGQGGVC